MMYTDIIPENLTFVNLPPEIKPKELPRLTSLDFRFLGHLIERQNYWSKENRLQKDGSFFIGSKNSAKILKISERSIRYSKKRLATHSLIRYRITTGKSLATYYWILDRPPKPPQEISPQAQKLSHTERIMIRNELKHHSKEEIIKEWTNYGLSRAEIETCFEP